MNISSSAFHRWLRLHRLHKYLYVFANLTYEEILSITEMNIDEFQDKVDIARMTVGAKNKILREIADLRQRKILLIQNIIMVRILKFLNGMGVFIRNLKKLFLKFL